MTKRWIMLCVMCLLMPVVAVPQQVVRERPVTLQLDVNRQGQVTSVKVMGAVHLTDSAGRKEQLRNNTALPEVLSKAVVKVASRWRFAAPRLAGKPVSGRTYAQATLQIVKQDDGTFRLHLKYHRNGPFINVKIAPGYPNRLRHAGRGAALVADAMVEPDGSVSQVRILKVFTNIHVHGASFAKVARDAIQHWKGVPMQIDGHAVATHVRIPLYFSPGSSGKTVSAKYEKQVRNLLMPNPGTSPAADRFKSSDVLALDSPFVKLPSSRARG